MYESIISALRRHAHDDMGCQDVSHVHVASQAADEIERLRCATPCIMPLAWVEPSGSTNGCWVAKTSLGTYSVAFEDGWFATLEDGLKWEWEPEEDPRSYSGPVAAQKACQEHFERTIRSALQTTN